MDRIETFLDGRLAKVTELVEVPDFTGDPYPSQQAALVARARYLIECDGNVPTVPGAWRWELDGVPISEDTAQALLA